MQNHRLTNFVKNEFPKSKHFDWVIGKVLSFDIPPKKILKLGKLLLMKLVNR